MLYSIFYQILNAKTHFGVKVFCLNIQLITRFLSLDLFLIKILQSTDVIFVKSSVDNQKGFAFSQEKFDPLHVYAMILCTQDTEIAEKNTLRLCLPNQASL